MTRAPSDAFIHPKALCESDDIGAGSRIWAFAHVLRGARIGRNCNVSAAVFIEGGVSVGDEVTIKCGVQLWDGVTLEDRVFVGPNATFTNDPYPRSKVYPDAFARTIVRKGASIGANATILPGIEIGAEAMVGAGAVVTRSVPPHAVVVGNPARIIRYQHGAPDDSPLQPGSAVVMAVRPAGEPAGGLSIGRFAQQAPFMPEHHFLAFGPAGLDGDDGDAGMAQRRFVICVRGVCSLLLHEDGRSRTVQLDRPELGLYLPPMTRARFRDQSPDVALLIFVAAEDDRADPSGHHQLEVLGAPR